MKEESLRRLLYVSKISASAAGQLTSTMEDILLESHGRNSAANVTGFLWSDGLVFAQALEGPQTAIEAIFISILKDPRHRGLEVRFDEAVNARRFARWSMCGMTLSDLDERIIDGEDATADLYRLPAETVTAKLERLCEAYGPALDAQHRRIVAASAAL